MARKTANQTHLTTKRKRRSSKEVWAPRTATPAEMEKILQGKTKAEKRAITELMGAFGLLPGSEPGLLQISALADFAEKIALRRMNEAKGGHATLPARSSKVRPARKRAAATTAKGPRSTK